MSQLCRHGRRSLPSALDRQSAGHPPASYGFPLLGAIVWVRRRRLAAITNYVALSATHFTCMQYSDDAEAGRDDRDSHRRRTAQRHDRAGDRPEHEILHGRDVQHADRLRNDRAGR